MVASSEKRNTHTHYRKHTDIADIIHQDMHMQPSVSVRAPKTVITHLNENTHTHTQHVIPSYTICQVIKAASNYVTQHLPKPDKHMPAAPHTQLLLC